MGIDIDIVDRMAGHRRSASDIWEFVENLSASRSISFGQSVASKPYGRNDIKCRGVVVDAPLLKRLKDDFAIPIVVVVLEKTSQDHIGAKSN